MLVLPSSCCCCCGRGVDQAHGSILCRFSLPRPTDASDVCSSYDMLSTEILFLESGRIHSLTHIQLLSVRNVKHVLNSVLMMPIHERISDILVDIGHYVVFLRLARPERRFLTKRKNSKKNLSSGHHRDIIVKHCYKPRWRKGLSELYYSVRWLWLRKPIPFTVGNKRRKSEQRGGSDLQNH